MRSRSYALTRRIFEKTVVLFKVSVRSLICGKMSIYRMDFRETMYSKDAYNLSTGRKIHKFIMCSNSFLTTSAFLELVDALSKIQVVLQ